ncbi:MAG TPA: hypothetical protein PLU47_02175 [Azonexus sp.]|nr:hypothetical protein [Azonexus sp.]
MKTGIAGLAISQTIKPSPYACTKSAHFAPRRCKCPCFGSIYVVKINYKSVWEKSLDWADREGNLTGLKANFLTTALVQVE